jgi:hypothetical protein
MRLTILLLAMLVMGGCVSSPVKLGEFALTSRFDDAKVGQVQTKAPGEVLVAKGVRTVVPAIELVKATVFNKAEGEASHMTCAFTVHAGTYPKRGTYLMDPQGVDCFGPVNVQITLANGTTNWNCQGRTFMADICGGTGKYFVALLALKADLKQQFDQVRQVQKVQGHDPNLVQQVLYAGRIGNKLGLTYREFTNDVDRPSFVQELQYDFDESKVLSFRALKIEVVEATNAGITYRVMSGL